MSDHPKPSGNFNPEQFRQLFEETKRNASKLHEIGSDYKRAATFLYDFAEEGLLAAPSISSSDYFLSAQQRLHDLNNHLSKTLSFLQNADMGNASGLFFHGTATLSAITEGFSMQQVSRVPYLQPSKNPSEGFHKLASHPTLKMEVEKQIERLRLNGTDGGKNALKQLNAAWNAHLEGTESPTSSLIPIREAINQVINELLRRRAIQEKVDQKIIGIGIHLGASYTTLETFQSLDSEWTKLNDRLSGAKHGKLDRHEEQELMRKATLFLVQLLEAIDPNKIRQ